VRRRAAEVVVVEAQRATARALRVAREEGALRVVAAADARGDDPRSAAKAALDQLAAPRRTPVHVITLDVTATCLDLPALLPTERLRELVRWELEPLVAGGGDLACAWSDRVLTIGDTARRLGLGLRRDAIDAWKDRLAGHELVALYPRVLSAVPLVEKGGRVALVEARGGAIGSAILRDGVVESVRLRAQEGPLGPDQLLELASVDARSVLISGEAPEALRVVLERAGIEVASLPEDAALLGAARHALGLAGSDRLAAVRTREPAPPIHREPWARAAAAGVALLALLLAYDASLGHARDERVRLGDDLARRAPPRPAAVVTAEPRSAVASEVTDLETEEKALAYRRSRLEQDVLANDGLPLALLEGIARSTEEDVTIDRVKQGKPGQWQVTGFALSDTAVQHFSVALGRALAARGLETELQGVRSERGRLDVAGWAFEVGVARSGRGRP
jgi:hypothetical protein